MYLTQLNLFLKIELMIHGSLERIWFRNRRILLWFHTVDFTALSWCLLFAVEFIFWNICPYFCPNYVVVVHISVLKGHFQWYFGLRDNEEVLKFELLTCPKCLRIEIANTLISRLQNIWFYVHTYAEQVLHLGYPKCKFMLVE